MSRNDGNVGIRFRVSNGKDQPGIHDARISHTGWTVLMLNNIGKKGIENTKLAEKAKMLNGTPTMLGGAGGLFPETDAGKFGGETT